MRFQLPQFIQTEIKLIGPFTLKQFLWVAGGTALIFVAFMVIGPRFLFFVFAVPVSAVSLALAFVRIQDMPLINYLAYALAYVLNPKRYLYQQGASQDLPVSPRTPAP
ncbi:MAG: PrgI family protein [Patescibacteria group bacterium]